jgi:hypothetical protein
MRRGMGEVEALEGPRNPYRPVAIGLKRFEVLVFEVTPDGD